MAKRTQHNANNDTRLPRTIVSERELRFTFAICYRPSVRLSVICKARAAYSGG